MNILVCDPIAKEAIKRLQNAGFIVDEKIGMAKEELIQTIPDYEIVIVRSATKITREVLESAPKLKVVFRGGVGLDNIDQEVAKEKGIKVLNTPGASSISVAELAIGFMFSLARRIPLANMSTKQGKWEKKLFKGSELFGKTLGLLGAGRIGCEVAKRAVALGMNVIAYDPYVKKSNVDGMELVEFDRVIRESDYISLHMPLTDKTKHLLNKEQFEMMKDGVRIIQCARGGIIDEDALYDAIKEGKVIGVGIDVYENEPAKENRLFELDEVIATPHIGASTIEGQLRVGMEIADRLIEMFAS